MPHVSNPTLTQNPRGRHRLDEHLDDVAEVLRLDSTRRRTAETAAGELYEWVQSDPGLQNLSPHLYPQGSFLIQTTVRPRDEGQDCDEFDLDMVIELREGWTGTPDLLFELVWSRLRMHPIYGKYAIKKRRCVCIDFPGEFHMDVLPARPDLNRRSKGFATAIEVPDRKLSDWKESDPRAFAEWFEQRCKDRLSERFLKASMTPISEDYGFGLDALRKSVQLTKRHRDVVFNGDDDAPRSIVLTTLLADNYYGISSTYLALCDSIDRVIAWAESAHGVPLVLNPVNEEENFAEAWDDKSFAIFKEYMADFSAKLKLLDKMHGPVDIGKCLAGLFDEGIAVAAMKRFGERQEQIFVDRKARYDPKSNCEIVVPSGVASAILGISTRAVPKGTNFGE
ncbi:hypothetical protein COB72_03270 [bacterium]|nr:MAG: hypothetical protein COB72_03270 [bacterium]